MSTNEFVVSVGELIGSEVEVSECTVRRLANNIRQYSGKIIKQANFAKLCMAFEQRINDLTKRERKNVSDAYARYSKVVEIMAEADVDSDPQTIALGLVWLDGHGHGDMLFGRLTCELKFLREKK